MSNVSQDKICLSTPVIKAVAKALGSGQPVKQAILQAQHANTPKGLVLTTANETCVRVRSQIVWVSGTRGSRKTETAYAWLREAARGGRPTVMMTTETEISRHWAPEDVLVLGTDCDNLVAEIRSSTHPHIIVRTKRIAQARTLMSILDALPAKALIAVDEMDWRSVRDRNMILPTRKGQLVGLTQIDDDVEHLRKPEDAFVGMFTPSPSGGGRVRKLLREGEAVYLTVDDEIEVVSPYTGHEIGLPLLSKDEQSVALKLEDMRPRLEKLTHTERLEAVAKSCGYRSWHAAQGRRT